MGNYDYIKQNIMDVKERIKKASEKSGRKFEDINLITVTKNVEVEKIITASNESLKDFGENRVQELLKKYDILKEGYDWHLIGHLQTNKVKYIIDKVCLIHSVDRIDLVKEIQKRAQKSGTNINLLIQVNVSGEETKYGLNSESVYDFILETAKNKNITVKGLMTIAPFVSNPKEVRYVFKKLREIFVDISKEKNDNINMEYLSMGMSNDFEVAIEEGANMVRIGTAIFGKRPD